MPATDTNCTHSLSPNQEDCGHPLVKALILEIAPGYGEARVKDGRAANRGYFYFLKLALTRIGYPTRGLGIVGARGGHRTFWYSGANRSIGLFGLVMRPLILCEGKNPGLGTSRS